MAKLFKESKRLVVNIINITTGSLEVVNGIVEGIGSSKTIGSVIKNRTKVAKNISKSIDDLFSDKKKKKKKRKKNK